MNRREALQKTAMMLGYAVSIPAITGVLNGCQATPGIAFKPVFFNDDQARSVEILSEIIIPKTSTPGAIEVGVPSFIDQMLKNAYGKQDQDEFLQGLADLDRDANEAYGNNFTSCSTTEQETLFKKYHDAAFAVPLAKPALGWWNPRPADKKPFILRIKELVLLGFFTSQIGATQVLKYKQVPGPFKGCIPFADVGKTWAT